MAWTSPMTAVANDVFTAAQFNTHVRDNLLETAPAKAASAGEYFVADGSNSLVSRKPVVDTEETSATVSVTSWGDPDSGGAAPSVTVDTGTIALVGIYAEISNDDSATRRISMSYEVTGASSISPSYNRQQAYSNSGSTSGSTGLLLRSGSVFLHTDLTAGSNTFTAKYEVSSGTGTVDRRQIWVLPF